MPSFTMQGVLTPHELQMEIHHPGNDDQLFCRGFGTRAKKHRSIEKFNDIAGLKPVGVQDRQAALESRLDIRPVSSLASPALGAGSSGSGPHGEASSASGVAANV